MIFSKAKGQSRGFIFTKRTQSEKGIVATVLSLMSFVMTISAIHSAYKLSGEVLPNIAAMSLISVVFAVAALIFGIIGMREPDSFRLFPIIGLVFTAIDLFTWGFCIYLGVG